MIDSTMIRHILERITVRGADDGERFTDTARVDAIASSLSSSDWRLYVDGALAKIYAHSDFDPKRPVVIVSSHVDMVADRCYADCSGKMWQGTFDNLITNAVVVACMMENSFGTNVLVAFTGDEEDESGGADEVIETLDHKGIAIQRVVVTDVTEEGWENTKSFSIENVLPEGLRTNQQRVIAALRAAVSSIDADPCVVADGEEDEAWEYDEYDLPCCSVCLPCCGDMHSEIGVTIRADSLCDYARALVAIIADVN